MVYYETTYKTFRRRRGPRSEKTLRTRRYRSKELTPEHARLRESSAGSADTCRCDTSIPWPFGVYAEVIAKRS